MTEATSLLDGLAAFGGEAAFAAPLHVGLPSIPDRERIFERIGGALDRRWLTNGGPLVAEFEQRIAELTHADHCVAVSSATIGLQLTARALDLTGEVIVPSFTFVGTAHALSWIGLQPRFCEIDPRTHTLDVQAVKQAITDKTSAIMGVHLWGHPCDVEGLSELADGHDLRLVFDAAHGLGCWHGGRPLGTFGDAEVFSFHATKIASSAEGGAITTNDGALAERLRLMRNFGFAGYDTVVEVGTNGKMSELSGALGLSSLEQLDVWIEHNRRNHELYEEHLGSVPGIQVGQFAGKGRHSYPYVVLEVDPRFVSRDDLIAVLHAENVLARRYFYPGCHKLEPYCRDDWSLPVTEAVASSVLVMPTGPSIGQTEIAKISSVLRVATASGDELRRRLSAAR